MNWLYPVQRLVVPLVLITGCICVLCPFQAAAQVEGKAFAGRGQTGVSVPLPPERAQRVKLLQMEVDHATIQLKTRLAGRTEELEQLYRSYRFDARQCQQLHQEIRKLQEQLLELHLQFQVRLRTLLTEAEFEMLQQRLREHQNWKARKWNGKPGIIDRSQAK
jgi:hypothetical protein